MDDSGGGFGSPPTGSVPRFLRRFRSLAAPDSALSPFGSPFKSETSKNSQRTFFVIGRIQLQLIHLEGRGTSRWQSCAPRERSSPSPISSTSPSPIARIARLPLLLSFLGEPSHTNSQDWEAGPIVL